MSQPPNGTIRAPDARWRAWSGVFRSSAAIVSDIGKRCGAIRVYFVGKARSTAPVSRDGAQRHRGVDLQAFQCRGELRRGHGAGARQFVCLENRAAAIDEKQVVVAQAGEVVKVVRRQHNRGTTIPLGLERAGQPARRIRIERLPGFVEQDEIEMRTRKYGPQTEELACSARRGTGSVAARA